MGIDSGIDAFLKENKMTANSQQHRPAAHMIGAVHVSHFHKDTSQSVKPNYHAINL